LDPIGVPRLGRLINWGRDQTVPYGTDSQLDVFQAMNCLATIIQCLRDKNSHLFLS
jgi:hypothetical protein